MPGVRECLCVSVPASPLMMPLSMHRLKKAYNRGRSTTTAANSSSSTTAAQSSTMPGIIPHATNPTGTNHDDAAVLAVAVNRGQLAAIASSIGAAPSKTGVLLKFTNVVKGWKRRLFVLENGVLVYGTVANGSNDDADEFRNSMSTRPPVQSQSTSAQKHFSQHPSLCPRNSDEPSDMFGNGHHASASVPFHNVASTDSSVHDASFTAAALTPRPRARMRAKRRLLRRHGSKDERERDIKGSINLQFAVISADDSDPLRFAIDMGNDVYHCKAETQEERDEWVSVLNASNEYFKGLIRSAASRAKERPLSPSASSANVMQAAAPALQPEANSEESDDSVLEDDGLREAEESRKALMEELRHVVEFWRSKWVDTKGSLAVSTEVDFVKSLADAFSSDPDSARIKKDASVPETAKALLDLTAWSLHVLRTNDEMYDRRLKADLALMMGRGVPVFPHGSPPAAVANRESATWDLPEKDAPYDDDSDEDDDDDDDLEFFDALSRSASVHSTVSSTRRIASNMSVAQRPRVSIDELAVIAGKSTDSPTTSNELVAKKPEPRLNRIKTAHLRSNDGSRTRLPPITGPRDKLSIWSVLKDSVGKDLSKISIPVVFNEPLSFVQRLAEDVEYSELFDQAAAEPDQYLRLMYVAAAVISHYSSTLGRVGKPFNPLLGETFELVLPNKGKGLRFVAEQVSHHPPISACYAEGTGGSWKYYNAMEVKNKFWGKSLEVFPTGLNHVEIPEYGDHFVFEQVTTCVHNLVVGRMWLDNYGNMEIVNRRTRDKCTITFNKTGWMSDSRSFASIKGVITDKDGREKVKLGGNWTESVYQDLGRGKRKTLWNVAERPDASASNGYNLTKWAICLNEPVADHLRADIAPTDSRFRPDQRALEDGQSEIANTLKSELEEGQRERRRLREASGEDWKPQWFEKKTDKELGRDYYKFTGEYFHCKNERDWSRSPDLFSCARNAGPNSTT